MRHILRPRSAGDFQIDAIQLSSMIHELKDEAKRYRSAASDHGADAIRALADLPGTDRSAQDRARVVGRAVGRPRNITVRTHQYPFCRVGRAAVPIAVA